MSRSRRQFLLTAAAIAPFAALAPSALLGVHDHSPSTVDALKREADYWASKVSPAAWRILFEEATERPGSSPLNQEKREGTFVCAACYLPLFKSEWKYESGTGWPSFYEMLDGHLGFKRDFKLVWPRKEYHCARCGGHQGHVFDDGPRPTGLRYCNNGLALRFVPSDEKLPELRG